MFQIHNKKLLFIPFLFYIITNFKCSYNYIINKIYIFIFDICIYILYNLIILKNIKTLITYFCNFNGNKKNISNTNSDDNKRSNTWI